jgi:hypothetical protein
MRGQALQFLGEYNNPTGSKAYGDIMGLASERSAINSAEEQRLAREASQRRGYGGGSAGRRAASDRAVALALAGGEAATGIREQAGGMYKTATEGYAGLVGGYNQQMSQRNLAYAGALNEAKQLQAQLDSAFNNQLIDAAKYEQMSASVQAQLDFQREKLAAEMPLNWARAETERIGVVGSAKYDLPSRAGQQLHGPAGMNPREERQRSRGGEEFFRGGSGGRFGPAFGG